MTKFRDSVLGSVIILAAVCLAMTTTLVVINSFTKEIIAANSGSAATQAYKELVPDASGFTILDITLPEGVKEAVSADDGLGYVFSVATKGYGGEVTFIIATNMAGEYTAIKMLEGHTETPTFGGRIGEPEYLETYYGHANPDGVDGLAGVTITSNALKKALSLANETFNSI